jgi:hypothetical protein
LFYWLQWTILSPLLLSLFLRFFFILLMQFWFPLGIVHY